MMADFALDTSILAQYYIVSPENLKMVFKHLSKWESLRSVSLHIEHSKEEGRCEIGHEGFMALAKKRGSWLRFGKQVWAQRTGVYGK
jgi:hypothetical protein